MEFEAEEPSRGSLAALGQADHDAVAGDAEIMTNPQSRGVDEADAAAGSHARLQITGQCRQGLRNALDKTVVAQQMRKLAGEVQTNVLEIKVLEIAVVRGMEEDQKGHDLAETHPARAVAMGLAIAKKMLLPERLKDDGKLVEIIK
jgi:hypothetical protein